jgi:hypothetical protein
MKLRSILSAMLLGVGLHSASAQSFFSSMDGAQDGGGGRTGTGLVYLFLTGSTLTLSNGAYSGLSGLVTAAHIHGPGAPGVAAGVLYNLVPAFITTGGNAGTITGGNISLVDNANGSGFTVAQQLTQLNSGLWYVNIHTSPNFGGGEIRGQIVLVPEPSSAVLLILGGVCTVACLRRKSREL